MMVIVMLSLGCGWFIGECDAIKPAASSLGLQWNKSQHDATYNNHCSWSLIYEDTNYSYYWCTMIEAFNYDSTYAR